MTDTSTTQVTKQTSSDALKPGTEKPKRLRHRSACQQLMLEALNVATKDLLPINIDVTTATGAVPEMKALRARTSKLGARHQALRYARDVHARDAARARRLRSHFDAAREAARFLKRAELRFAWSAALRRHAAR